MSKALDKLDRYKALKQRRDLWLPIWQELSDIMQPNRGGFTSSLMPGQETSAEIYDSTPRQACRSLATAIDGLMKPSTSKWFWMRATDDELNEVDEVKLWFDDVQKRMWSAIYNPEARFIQHSGAVDYDIATFGLGYLWISENKDRNGLLFRSLHIGDVAIDENADGQVDTCYITRRWTARQFIQRFGEDKVTPKIREALAQPSANRQSDKLFEFVQAIEPRSDYDKRSYDNKNAPFSNCVVSVEDEKIIEENGFQEFPVAVPRWEVAANQIYPRSAGMMALPDSRTLQAMGHTLLVGGQLAVDPPKWIASDGVMSAVRTYPGGLTVIDSEAIRATNGKPMGVLEAGANIPIGREMQDDYRKMVESAFLKNIFNLPVEGPDMTAYEVSERKQEFIRQIGPTLGQMEPDYIGAIISRVFGIMSGPNRDFKAGALEPPPDVLAGRDVKFEFMSPIQQARRQIEVAGMAMAFESIGPIIAIQPETGDNFNGDEIARDMPESFNLPHKWIRSKEDVAAMRQQRQQAVASQGALAEGQGIADIVKTATEAGNNAVATEQMQNGAAV